MPAWAMIIPTTSILQPLCSDFDVQLLDARPVPFCEPVHRLRAECFSKESAPTRVDSMSAVAFTVKRRIRKSG